MMIFNVKTEKSGVFFLRLCDEVIPVIAGQFSVRLY